MGYTVIAISLFALVQSVNVYPQLLCGRLLFSLGASCVSTMVTAILPTMVSRVSHRGSSECRADREGQTQARKRHFQLAGFVGLFTGTGALLAVGLYLPLPSRLQQLGLKSERALADTYYFAGGKPIPLNDCLPWHASRVRECETYVDPVQYLDQGMLIPELASYRHYCCRCVLLRAKSEKPQSGAGGLQLGKGSLGC